jgi:hypothetical protein
LQHIRGGESYDGGDTLVVTLLHAKEQPQPAPAWPPHEVRWSGLLLP